MGQARWPRAGAGSARRNRASVFPLSDVLKERRQRRACTACPEGLAALMIVEQSLSILRSPNPPPLWVFSPIAGPAPTPGAGRPAAAGTDAARAGGRRVGAEGDGQGWRSAATLVASVGLDEA